MTFKGKAKVQWTEREGSGDNRRTVTYWNEEKYFDQSLYVFGSHDSKSELSAGEHVYPFAYQVLLVLIFYAVMTLT